MKVDPRTAARKMREDRKADGSMKFTPDELLNSKQIASLFSTFKKKSLDANEKVTTDILFMLLALFKEKIFEN